MEFVVLVIALLARVLLSVIPTNKHDLWFNRWCEGCSRGFSQVEPAGFEETKRIQAKWGTGTFFLSVIFPVAALSVLMDLLGQVAWGLPALGLSLAVLLYSFSRKESDDWFKNFQTAWRHNDSQAAYEYAREVIPKHNVKSQYELFISVFKRLLYLRFCDFFMVVFWFMVLGAEGALLARLSQLMDRSRVSSGVVQFRWLLEWLPARLLGLSFMLTGNVLRTSRVWFSTLFNRNIPMESLLYRYACAAMGAELEKETSSDDAPESLKEEDKKLQRLESFVQRSIALWVGGLAVMTLFI